MNVLLVTLAVILVASPGFLILLDCTDPKQSRMSLHYEHEFVICREDIVFLLAQMLGILIFIHVFNLVQIKFLL